MEQQLLFEKYHKGKHWGSHSVSNSERFSKFLKEHNFNGLLIDVGCGGGKDVNMFFKKGFEVLGIDNDKEELKLAKSNYPNYNFELENIENLKFEDNMVSAFFMINVIHYTKMEKTIKEIYRTLNKKGYLFIHFNMLIIDEKGKIDYEYKKEDILDLVSDFKIIERRIIKRVDNKPIKHTHKIMELILQKD